MSAPDDMVRRIRENLPHIEWEQPLAAEQERLAADEIERLRAVLDAIDALHQPYPLGDGRIRWQHCDECDFEWPCPTHLLIHPKEAEHG